MRLATSSSVKEPTHTEVMDAYSRRTVLRLTVATALAGANAFVIFATAAIVGAVIAPSSELVTLPISIYVVGLVCGTLPVGVIARRYGRRASFQVGCLFGAACGFLAAHAIVARSFHVYCLATFCGGLYSAVSQSYRFAAADEVSAPLRAKAISYVFVGGVAAGFIGPQLVQTTMGIWPEYAFAASYIGQGIVALLALFVVSSVKPSPAKPLEELESPRSILAISREPRFIAAVVCGSVAFGGMNLLMTSAPLAMKLCGLSLTQSNYGIQWHAVAMYLPSFVTGSLITRYGPERIAAVGLSLIGLTALVDMAGTTIVHFWLGLVILGVGWNFAYIGASTMIATSSRRADRNKAQAFNDFFVFGTMAVGSFSSGAVLISQGWSAVNLLLVGPVIFAVGCLIITQVMNRRQLAG